MRPAAFHLPWRRQKTPGGTALARPPHRPTRCPPRKKPCRQCWESKRPWNLFRLGLLSLASVPDRPQGRTHPAADPSMLRKKEPVRKKPVRKEPVRREPMKAAPRPLSLPAALQRPEPATSQAQASSWAATKQPPRRPAPIPRFPPCAASRVDGVLPPEPSAQRAGRLTRRKTARRKTTGRHP